MVACDLLIIGDSIQGLWLVRAARVAGLTAAIVSGPPSAPVPQTEHSLAYLHRGPLYVIGTQEPDWLLQAFKEARPYWDRLCRDLGLPIYASVVAVSKAGEHSRVRERCEFLDEIPSAGHALSGHRAALVGAGFAEDCFTFFDSDEGWLDASALCRALREQFAAEGDKGVTLVQGRVGPAVRDERSWIVPVNGEAYRARSLIIAAGSSADVVATVLGLQARLAPPKRKPLAVLLVQGSLPRCSIMCLDAEQPTSWFCVARESNDSVIWSCARGGFLTAPESHGSPVHVDARYTVNGGQGCEGTYGTAFRDQLRAGARALALLIGTVLGRTVQTCRYKFYAGEFNAMKKPSGFECIDLLGIGEVQVVRPNRLTLAPLAGAAITARYGSLPSLSEDVSFSRNFGVPSWVEPGWLAPEPWLEYRDIVS